MAAIRDKPTKVNLHRGWRLDAAARRSGMSLVATATAISCVMGVAVLCVSFFLAQSRDLPITEKPIGTEKRIGPEKPTAPVLTEVPQPAHTESAPSRFYEVTIHQPDGPPRIDIGLTSMHGEKMSVACSTCHTSREPNILNRASKDLDEFHQGMGFSHGNLTCLACHNPKDYDTLHLADRTALEFQQVMSLCSQCHGTQRRDYDHGAHGGMTGYWDLSRGPRVRNNCVDCHSPHQPKFPKMNPTFKPRDRFLESHEEVHHD